MRLGPPSDRAGHGVRAVPVALTDYRAVRSAVVALGTFDGVHLGHQALLCEAAAWAGSQGWVSLAFAFAKPPGNYLGTPKPMLLPPAHKFALIEQFVDQAVFAEFPELASMTPEAFARGVLCHSLGARGVIVGADYGFGKDRRGDVARLERLGRALGFGVRVVAPVLAEGQPVSSTRIRRAIRQGQVAQAARLLGRPPLVRGRVVPGEGRGRGLGFPTANLDTDEAYVLPEQGIFAAVACLEGRPHPAAAYFGTKPTFDGRHAVVEVHLIQGTFLALYDAELDVHLIEKVRDDEVFADAHALRAQIQSDIDRITDLLETAPLQDFCGKPRSLTTDEH